MKSRLRNAGVTALGMVAVGYVGGKEGLKLVIYPDFIVFGPAITARKGMHKGMRFTRGQCDSMLIDSLVDQETGMRPVSKTPDAIPDNTPALRFHQSKPSFLSQNAATILRPQCPNRPEGML
jgi:hypothetical protein